MVGSVHASTSTELEYTEHVSSAGSFGSFAGDDPDRVLDRGHSARTVAGAVPESAQFQQQDQVLAASLLRQGRQVLRAPRSGNQKPKHCAPNAATSLNEAGLCQLFQESLSMYSRLSAPG